VTFHVEAVDDAVRAIAAARALGLGAGIAFNPGTPVEDAAAAAEGADLALCMSIQPGYSGQTLMPEALRRIEVLRGLLPSGVHVQVDGGVSEANVHAVHEAGADLIVAGSAVFWGDSPPAAYRRLKAAAEGAA
jgi:ribulose-phosphate 3-epimerase